MKDRRAVREYNSPTPAGRSRARRRDDRLCCERPRRSPSRSPDGARAIIPLESWDDVVTRSKQFERAGVPARRRVTNAQDGRVRSGQLPDRAFAGRRGRKDRPAHHGERHACAAGRQGARDAPLRGLVRQPVCGSARCCRARIARRARMSRSCAQGHDTEFSLEDTACAGRYVNQICKRIPSAEAERCGSGGFAHRPEVAATT